MKHNYLLFSFNLMLKKYRKYFSRLQRHLSKGTFAGLSASRKNFLVKKVEEIRTRLMSLQPKLAGTIAAAGLLTALNISSAEAQTFVFNSAKNPFVGGASSLFIPSGNGHNIPGAVDLDNDGDQDFLANSSYEFIYYQNTGSVSSPAFTEAQGSDNPFFGLSLANPNSSVSFADMDDDGDFDMISSGNFRGYNLIITYYENTGTASSPSFVVHSGTDSPFPDYSGYTGRTSAAFADIDGDGDKDVFLADGYYGRVHFYENIGTASSPIFNITTSGNPFPSGDLTANDPDQYLFITFADIDSDGDQDAFMGQSYDEIIFYKNTGTATAAVMSLQSGSNNPVSAFNSDWLAPAFADMDGDMDLDLILGKENTGITVYFNSGTATAPSFPVESNFGEYSRLRCVDLDGDGDQDITFSGAYNEGVNYVVNNGPATAPVFTEVAGTANPFNNIYSIFSNTFADLDGDMDLDLVTGGDPMAGNFLYFENTGTATAASFSEITGTTNPLDGLTNGGNAPSPILVDLDNDGDQDLVSGERFGSVVYFQNTGTSTGAVFSQQTGTDNPFDAINSGNYNYLTFVNFDGDGDMDLLIGTGSDGLHYYQNTGTAASPSFSELTGTNNPFDFINTDYDSQDMYYGPAFMDIDADGDLDLFVSQDNGTVKLFENTSPVTSVFNNHSNSSAFGSEVVAYPNPVKDVLNFSLNDAIGSTMTISVKDMTGMEMMSESTVNNGSAMTLDVSSLNTGVYMLRISSDSKVAVVKFVKQ